MWKACQVELRKNSEVDKTATPLKESEVSKWHPETSTTCRSGSPRWQPKTEGVHSHSWGIFDLRPSKLAQAGAGHPVRHRLPAPGCVAALLIQKRMPGHLRRRQPGRAYCTGCLNQTCSHCRWQPAPFSDWGYRVRVCDFYSVQNFLSNLTGQFLQPLRPYL